MGAGAGTTAQWPVQVALEAALVADAPLVALLGTDATGVAKVYDSQAPGDAALDYVVIGDATEGRGGAASTFGRGGHAGRIALHVWAATREAAAAIHAHVARILDGQRLTLAGHSMVIGRLALIASFPDPSGAHHRVLHYETLTRPAAA